MPEFKPIETQERLDAIIGERVSRAEQATKEKVEKELGEKYADYDDIKKQLDEANKKVTGYEATIAKNKTDYDTLSSQLSEANGKIKTFEADEMKRRVAAETGLPAEMSSYLKGETEEELKASAKELGQFTKVTQISPLANLENGVSKKGGKKEALKKLFADLKGE